MGGGCQEQHAQSQGSLPSNNHWPRPRVGTCELYANLKSHVVCQERGPAGLPRESAREGVHAAEGFTSPDQRP